MRNFTDTISKQLQSVATSISYYILCYVTSVYATGADSYGALGLGLPKVGQHILNNWWAPKPLGAGSQCFLMEKDHFLTAS